eukprot:Phypoly_transcript_20528.p1 GENE.Phypoly_transcript_20528~~Phypoly_transcript_20528.p1  ORF type:complete len:111 (-),score=0.99 Phypoly_transcript_20528:210-542(-)
MLLSYGQTRTNSKAWSENSSLAFFRNSSIFLAISFSFFVKSIVMGKRGIRRRVPVRRRVVMSVSLYFFFDSVLARIRFSFVTISVKSLGVRMPSKASGYSSLNMGDWPSR